MNDCMRNRRRSRGQLPCKGGCRLISFRARPAGRLRKREWAVGVGRGLWVLAGDGV